MKVSVVIPCYNMGAYLEDALDSVKAQTFNDWEILVVDDGSTDRQTIAKLKEVETKYPNCTVLHKKNSGLAGARNYGIERARGTYITCLDADDMFEPSYLEKTVQALDSDKAKKNAFVTTWLREFGVRNDIWKTSSFDEVHLLITNLVHAGSLFRKSVWKEVGGYKKMRIGGYEDWNFWLSIVENGYQWTLIEEPLFLYRIRENSMLAGAKEAHIEIYKELHELHPKLFERNLDKLVIENAKEAKNLRDYIAEERALLETKDEEIERLREESHLIGEQIFNLRNELDDLKGSRLVGRAIKTRRAAGKLRRGAKRLAPQNVMHKVRVVSAPHIPATTRRNLKHSYHTVHSKILGLRTKTVPVTGKQWESGNPLVSVVIPFYNKADTLEETLNSLTNQTFKNFETIIVNDESPAPLNEAKVRENFTNSLQLQIINQKNQGVAAARNNGIAAALGKYIICLDPDDLLEPTYIEKSVIMLETSPGTSLVTTNVEAFGVRNEFEIKRPYDPLVLFDDNMVTTAAAFSKESWRLSGGYKSELGYEDWEFWINLAEHGFWGKSLPEPLFKYRTAAQSRYVEDRSKHWNNLHHIRTLHPRYRYKVKRLLARGKYSRYELDPSTALINVATSEVYAQVMGDNPRILLALPWLTFGGAETLIINFCQEIKASFELSIITGLESSHEWEYRFKELTSNIYHLTNLFGHDKKLYLEFISNYITTRQIDAIHIIHTDFMFEFLPELKRRHPQLKVVLTLFNDRASHFEKSLDVQQYIDAFSSDNATVARHYKEVLTRQSPITVIPNGINCYDIYNPTQLHRGQMRTNLGIGSDDLAVFFIGRVSEEKNPDVFVEVARQMVEEKGAKNLRFFVIGDGVMGRQIEKTITDFNNPRIVYLGYQTEIARYLSAADIFVLPSSVEGFPLSILEAMAMNVVVVASDVGAVSEIVEAGKEGFVVAPGSVTEIAAAIEKLSKDRTLLQQMKVQARKKIEGKYSNVLLGENYKKLYRRLLK